MNKSILFCVFFAFVLVGQLSAQKIVPPLGIGDTVTNIEFTNLINYSSKTARLSDFKGKLVILDFWATWCSSCIKQFPKLDALQKDFKGKIQILLINSKSTSDDAKRATDFFENKRNKDGEKYALPAELEDTFVDLLFPHVLIPHYVWISPNGTVLAITSSDEVTTQNIQKSIDGSNLEMRTKIDVNTERPLFLNNDAVVENIVQYALLTKGKIDGLPGGNSLRKTGNIIHGRAIMNKSILSIYTIAISNLFIDFHKNRMLLEVRDLSKLLCNSKDVNDIAIWERENLYSFDFIIPAQKADSLYGYMLQYLNQYSNYFGRVEKRKVKCLSLVLTDNGDKIKTKGMKLENKLYSKEKIFLQNGPIALLVKRLNNINKIEIPIIDETSYLGNIDIEIKTVFTSLKDIRQELNKYGLDLLEGKRDINMFVLSDKE